MNGNSGGVPMENWLYDYGPFALFAVIVLILIIVGRRKQKWCPKCKRASCVPVGKPVNDRQHMSCSNCGYNKQVSVKSHNVGEPIHPD